MLHDAASICSSLLLRPGQWGDEPEPIFAHLYDRGDLLEKLAPALADAWPDHPVPDADGLEAFLREAYRRFVASERALEGEEGFVPAALWTHMARGLLLEHLREEVDALVGGVHLEPVWTAWNAMDETRPMYELMQAGMRIKLRVVSDFLTGERSRHEDELFAAQFFPAGEWSTHRDTDMASLVRERQRFVHKQVAHLTATRPLPEERDIYRPDSYRDELLELVMLLEQFTAGIDARLLPDWWAEWASGLRARSQP
jgi:hypothetical protein